MENPMHDLENLDVTTIRITPEHEFNPDLIRSSAGAVVKVVNETDVDHTVTAEDGSFDVEIGPSGEGEIFVPGKGEHRFFCRYHEEMNGRLMVD